jgi:hypothetical protein
MNIFQYFVGWSPFVGIAVGILVHLVIAFSLNSDVNRRIEAGRPVAIVGPIGWFFLGLGGGFIALGSYWIMQYSTFRASENGAP